LNISQFYKSRVEYHLTRRDYFKKKEGYLSFLRLLSFIALIYLVILSFRISGLAGIISIFLAVAIFGYVLNLHLKTTINKQKHQYLSEINQAEINGLKGDYSVFPNGSQYEEKDHPYSNDLDIIGKYSIYQYLNRTNTEPGASLLANWLKHAAPYPEITERQEAIKELGKKFEWRQEMRSVFYINPSSAQNPKSFIDWCNRTSDFQKSERFLFLFYFQSIVSVTLFIFWMGGMPVIWLILGLLINISINYAYFKKINIIQSHLSRTSSLLQSYSDIIRLIEDEPFECQKLTELKSKLNDGGTASKNIKKLASITKKLDYRLNPLIGIPLNLFFFWDILQCLKLERWKLSNKDKINEWFRVMAEIEALSSLANLHYNQPDWVFPVITNTYFRLQAMGSGHPLIPSEKRILNDFLIVDKGKIALVTGSNMSGKSTFLRTCGVNIVLAMAGAPVCATKFETSYVHIYSSMRISDSLEENTSSFYAELKKLAQIIQVIEKKENVFLLLDEILRGTNSNDRHTGSVALIRQFIKNNVSGILATHDLGLSYLAEELPNNIDIYNFDVKIQGEELYFDYRINTGICKSLNASILMKKMGIEI
jgi:hypothetical protein